MNNQLDDSKTDMRQLPPTLRIEGGRVKQLREEKGLTQLYVATAVGVTVDTISRWENKRYPTVRRENVLKLAEILEVDVSEIMESGEKQDSAKKPETVVPACSCGTDDEEPREFTSGRKSEKPASRSLFPRIIPIILFVIAFVIAGTVYFLKRPHLKCSQLQSRPAGSCPNTLPQARSFLW